MGVGNDLIDLFLTTLTENNKNYYSVSETDKKFCEQLSKNFEQAKKISTKEDIFSFYILNELDCFVLNLLKNRGSFFLNEFGQNLGNVYYPVLKKYFNNKYNKNLDDVKWVLGFLDYVDNKCTILSLTSDKTYKKSIGSYDTFVKSNKNLVNRIENQEKVSKNLLDNIDKAQKNIDKVTESTNEQKTKLEQQEKKSIENNITILGIFVGIVAVLFGGISFVSLLSDKLLSANPIKSFMLITFMALILFDSILALFYYISKVTDKKLISYNDCWTHCKYMNDKNNKTLKKTGYFIRRSVCTIAQKSKFAFWSNVVLAEFLLFLFILYLFINNGRFNGDTKNGITFLNVVFAISLPAISSLIILYLARPCKCYYEYAAKELELINSKLDKKSDETQKL